MDIKSILEKRRKQLAISSGSMNVVVEDLTEELVTKLWEGLKPGLIADIRREMTAEIENLTQNIAKGEPGNDGSDYILTEKDKKQIASSIKVPVVEKVIERTEVIKEQPIVTNQITNEIKEVAKYETPIQIADKLNTLEEKVDITVIKGLNNWLTNLKKAIKEKGGGSGGGGGGMGNWLHESKSVGSTTTYVDTTSNIAAGGFAIFAFYQGQMIARGVAYTVSGKRLTLLFTPQDATFVDIIYIRS